MRKFQSIVFFTFVFLTQIIYSQVTVEYVTNINDLGAGSLRAALATGNDTVIIDVKGAVDVESSIPISSNVVIIGPSPKHFTIEMSNLFDVNGLFTFNNFDVELNNVELSSGINGVFNINSSNSTSNLKVSRCLFFENRLTSTNSNGATFSINNTSSNIKINACSFWGNESSVASGLGGAIYLNKGNLEVYNSTFHNNQSNKGGAICASSSSANNHLISIINNTFDNNVATQGNDLYLNNSDIHLRNNIFRNTDDPVYASGLNTLTTPQNNYTNYSGSSYSTLEHHSSLGLSNSNVTDGFGLMYYLFDNPLSPCIDVDSSPLINLQIDARRSWRKMYGKAVINSGQYFGSDAVDAGAVEYTPFRVLNSANSGVGSIVDVFDALNNPFVNSSLGQSKRAVVFELPINSGVIADIDLTTISLNVNSTNNDSLIINGYSQNHSSIAGPGINSNVVTPAFTPIQLNGGGGNGSRLIINTNYVFVSGISFVNSISTIGVIGSGIEVSNFSWDISIEGCNIGVEGNGMNISSNSFGIYSDAQTNVGVKKFLKGYKHASRNIITGNDSTQLRLIQGGTVSNNFIGLLGDGTSPGGTFNKGVEVLDGYATFYLGGNESQSNYFGKLNTAVEVPVGVIYNNYLGFEYDLQTASNIEYGIKTVLGTGSIGSPFIRKNFIGNILGNAIENIAENSEILGNTIGLTPNGRSQAAIGGTGIMLIGGASSLNNWTVNGANCKIGLSTTFLNHSESNIIVNCGNAGIAFSSGNFKDPFSEDFPIPSDTFIPIDCYIKGNYIGVDTSVANINANFGNGVGILIPDSIYKIQIDSNEIAKNIGAGIRIETKSKYNYITKNIMYQNGGLGIDLDANNTTNITDLTRPQSNDSLIPPEFLSVIYCNNDNSTKLKVRVYIEDYSLGYGIEFYEADVDSQEGYDFKKYEVISPTMNGWNTFEISYNSSVTINQKVIATLTMFQDSSLKEISTSEFSAPFTIGDYQPSFSSFEDSLCKGDTAVFQVANHGHFQSVANSFAPTQIDDSTGYFIGLTSGAYTLTILVDSLGCTETIDSVYSIFSLPGVNIGNDSSVCEGLTVDLNSIAVGGQWEEINSTPLGVGNTSVVINNDTSYVYMVSNSGCQNRDTINFFVLHTASHTINESICQGSNYSFGTQSLSTSGTYYETFVAANGCDSVVTLNLIVNTSVSNDTTVVICGGTYDWNGVIYTSSGTYPNTLSTVDGCDSLVTLYLTIETVIPETPNISGPINYCQDGDNSVVDIEPNNLGLEHSFLYNGLQHDFVDENIFFGHLDIEDDTIGFFVNSNGCYGDTLYLDINLIANDYTVGTSQVDYCEGDSIVFTIEGNSFDSVLLKYNAILDSYPNNDNLHFGVGNEGEYEFYISKSGCTFKDSLTISFDDNCGKGNVVTTTAFSPNGDLIENTTFNIDLDYINQGLSNVVTIYNRWGDVIYKVNDYKNVDNAWHGENQSGDSMPEGTYFYVVEVSSKNFSTSGWIYLDLK